MDIDKFNAWLNFGKFFLGTFILGIATFFVNKDIQNREIEIKEQEQIGKYIDHAIHEDVGLRLRFAQYFSNVSRSEVLRQRWSDYLKVVQTEFDAKKKEKEDLENKLSEETTLQERDRLLAEIAQLKEELDPKPTKAISAMPSRVYIHVASASDKTEAAGIKKILEGSSFSVPGIQVVDASPRKSEFRYFRKREKEFAVDALNSIQSEAEIVLRYIPGYENSSAIRDRHFEIWFSKDAFK